MKLKLWSRSAHRPAHTPHRVGGLRNGDRVLDPLGQRGVVLLIDDRIWLNSPDMMWGPFPPETLTRA